MLFPCAALGLAEAGIFLKLLPASASKAWFRPYVDAVGLSLGRCLGLGCGIGIDC